MAHLNHIRRATHVSHISMRETMNTDRYESFAVFGGSHSQRQNAGLQLMSNYFSNMGIVLLHNDPQFEASLGRIYSMHPENHRRVAMFLANEPRSDGSKAYYYDPLYGLSATAVLDTLAPLRQDGVSALDIQSLRSILSDYLLIMDTRFRLDSSRFGDYPYNLDLLLELTSFRFDDLRRNVLSYLPGDIRDRISVRLSAEGAQQKAYNAVLSFAQIMSNYIWTNRGFSGHSRLSITRTVRARQLISIYIPESRAELLDYLAVELQQLRNSGTHFLLVANGIDLNNSKSLKSLFLSDHSAMNYYTGILAENSSGAVDSNNNDELSSLFSQTDNMYVFQCASTMAARPFCDGIGNYYRRVTDHHANAHREPFHIFAGHGHGSIEREVQQLSINYEELTTLGRGCLFIGRSLAQPVIADNFIF